MAEYRESALTGARRMRAYQAIAQNPASGARAIEFREEWLTVLSDGRQINEPAGMLRKTFDAPDTTFDLLDPATGQAVGQMTYQEVYAALHSLYLHLAVERDAAQAAAEAAAAEAAATGEPAP